MTHIEMERLLDMLEGRSAGAEAESLRNHLAECKACTEEFDRWARLLDGLSHPPLDNAPPETIRRAVDLFEPRRESPSLAEIVAALVSDDWAEPAAAGLRGQAAVRMVCMATLEYDLDIRVVYNDRGIEVRGQLLKRGSKDFLDGFEVTLLDGNNRELAATVASGIGEFEFEKIPVEAGAVVAHLDDGRRIRCEIPERKPDE